MSRMRMLRCVAASAAVALAVGCSKSSTAPNAAVAGSWQVTWSSLPTGTSLTHMIDTLAVAQSAGGAYTVTFADVVFTNASSVNYAYDPLAGGSFAVSGNNVTWVAADALNMGCFLTVAGSVSGTSMQGTATQGGPTGCGTLSWNFAAVRI